MADTQYLYPSTWTNLTDTASNYAAGFPALANQAYENWYDQPLSTGITPELSAAYSKMTTGSQYDPAQLQQYLNPYTQQAAQATVSDLNRNLTENLMPGVNSTFTGAGQFGSSRNQDFANRAYRDTQEAAAKALAQANYGAYGQANQLYKDWTQLNLGQNLAAAQNKQQLEQQALDRNYQDWLAQQQYPLTALGALSSGVGNISRGVQPNISGGVTQPDSLSQAIAGLSGLNTVLSNPGTQNVINTVGSGLSQVGDWLGSAASNLPSLVGGTTSPAPTPTQNTGALTLTNPSYVWDNVGPVPY